MLIYLDLDTDRLVMSPGNAGLVSALASPRGSGPMLRVMPLRGGQSVPLPSGFEMTWTVKEQDDWGGDMVAFAEDFISEDGTTVYSCPVNYETAALDALLDIGETTERDSVSLLAQLAWRPSESAAWRPTQTVGLVLHNSVWRGVPGAPEPGPSAFSWLVGILAAAPGIELVDDTEAQTITIGLNLEAGPGLTLEVDGNTITVQQDIIVKIKSAAQIYDTETLTADDTLHFEAEANAVYQVEIVPLCLLSDLDALGSLLADLVLPAGAAVTPRPWGVAHREISMGYTALGFEPTLMPNAASIYLSPEVVRMPSPQHFLLTTGSTAGTVQMRFRVSTAAGPEDATVFDGSYLIARRIA
jgi:hypothetical protein